VKLDYRETCTEKALPRKTKTPVGPRFLTGPRRLARAWSESGAGNEVRTRDLNLGKVALYQLSYSR
jgi:hypothetical protein